MMFKILSLLSILLFSISAKSEQFTRADSWARHLVKSNPNRYKCHYATTILRKNESTTWEEEFGRNSEHIKTLQELNRRNSMIFYTHCIAIPKDDNDYEMLSHSPIPLKINNYAREKVVIVDLKVLAGGLYENGRLIRWFTANGGSKRCLDTKENTCYTPIGNHVIIRKEGRNYRSGKYPLTCQNRQECGHQMFWYMQIYKDGVGLHGNKWMVGTNHSHGCSRMYEEDAHWLNQNVEIGTKVIVLPY